MRIKRLHYSYVSIGTDYTLSNHWSWLDFSYPIHYSRWTSLISYHNGLRGLAADYPILWLVTIHRQLHLLQKFIFINSVVSKAPILIFNIVILNIIINLYHKIIMILSIIRTSPQFRIVAFHTKTIRRLLFQF